MEDKKVCGLTNFKTGRNSQVRFMTGKVFRKRIKR